MIGLKSCWSDPTVPTQQPSALPSLSPTPKPTPTPTSSPVAVEVSSPSLFYAVCGDKDNSHCKTKEGFTNIISAAKETHEVRCCSDIALSGFTQITGCDVWGASELTGLNGGSAVCHHASTHAEASAICAANGARLCTKDELLGKCTKGTGEYITVLLIYWMHF